MQDGLHKRNGKTIVLVAVIVVLIIAVVCIVVYSINVKDYTTVSGNTADSESVKPETFIEKIAGIFNQDKDMPSGAPIAAAGEYDGNEYNNARFGITAVFNDGWFFYDETERSRITEMAYVSAGRENTGGSIYDLYCRDKDKENNISIVIDDLKAIFGKDMTEEEYLAKTEESLKTDAMKGMNYGIASSKYGEVILSGSKHRCLDVNGRIGDTEISQRYIAIKDGNLMMLITMTAADGPGIVTMQDIFK